MVVAEHSAEALRESLAVKITRLYGARYNADDEITVVASASEGLYASISALVHAGDEVVYFEPAFDSYAPIVRLQGATPVPIRYRRAASGSTGTRWQRRSPRGPV